METHRVMIRRIGSYRAWGRPACAEAAQLKSLRGSRKRPLVRQSSSSGGGGDRYATFGHHSFAGTVRVRPGETTLELRVLVDKSIVEGFGAVGRGAVTGRVYPHSPESTRIRVFAGAAGPAVRVRSLEAWEMGSSSSA